MLSIESAIRRGEVVAVKTVENQMRSTSLTDTFADNNNPSSVIFKKPISRIILPVESNI
jgi:hypothetical protein